MSFTGEDAIPTEKKARGLLFSNTFIELKLIEAGDKETLYNSDRVAAAEVKGKSACGYVYRLSSSRPWYDYHS